MTPRTLMLLALTTAAAFAQTDAGGYRVGPVYSDKFPQVSIVLDVSLSQAAKTREIRLSDIQLVEDGTPTVRPSRIEAFKATGRGLAMVIAVDVSPSMNGRPLEAIKLAVRGVVGEMGPADRVALISFADDERVEVAFGAPPAQLRPAIEGLAIRGRATQLYRALVKALQLFEQEPQLPERRRIVIISDGVDEKSSYTFDNVREKTQRLRIPIDTIGLVRDPQTVNTVGISALERISDISGGNHRVATTMEGVQEAANTGIRWLQSTPVATFDLQNIGEDGRWHELAVRWRVFGGERSARLQSPRGTPEWIWWAAGATGLLLLGLIVRVSTQRRPQPVAVVQPAPIPAPVPAPVIPTPRPEPLPPVRLKTKHESQPQPQPNPQPEPQPKPASRRSTMVRIEFPEPQPGRPAAWLVAEGGPLTGRTFGIDSPNYWIGAGDTNQLVLEDDTVSWNHACIVFEHADLYVCDESRNGTLVNGEKIIKERRRLSGGDSIQVGRTTFRLDRR